MAQKSSKRFLLYTIFSEIQRKREGKDTKKNPSKWFTPIYSEIHGGKIYVKN